MPQRTAVVRRQDAADRRASGEWRIERQTLAVRRERVVDAGQRRARFRGGDQIAVLMRDEAVHTPRAEHDVDSFRHASPFDLGAGAANEHRLAAIGSAPQRRRELRSSVRLDDLRAFSGCRHSRSARPASSAG